MQIDFFATDDDIKQVWRWLFDVPNMKLFEDYSVPDKTNVWFERWDDFCCRFEDHKGSLAAWPSSVGGVPRKRFIEFEPNTQRKLNAKGRTVFESPALINILGLGDSRGCLGNTSIKCWNEKGARQRSFLSEEFCDEVDWPQFRSILGKIHRQLKKSCPAKLRNVPIMPDAFEKFQNGQIKLWNWGQECTHPSEFVTIV
jgi:hypothetical protein